LTPAQWQEESDKFDAEYAQHKALIATQRLEKTSKMAFGQNVILNCANADMVCRICDPDFNITIGVEVVSIHDLDNVEMDVYTSLYDVEFKLGEKMWLQLETMIHHTSRLGRTWWSVDKADW
jgi:hypothetical protein